ncbi:MAG TPA: alpha/beta hydrolase [Myxococcota bacterium]|nr:alpha/beta hydrolase [Myxococcota bacterium]
MRRFAAAALFLVTGCAVVPPPPRIEAQRIPYADVDPLQFGELRVPAGEGPFPLAIVIHGGCWRANVVSLRSTARLASALRDAGVATWNIEYRRVGDAGGGWPGTFRDVAAATDFARTLARTHALDLSRVVVVGHSAGAHLALWSAARARLPSESDLHSESPLRPSGVVALAGPGDLRSLDVPGGSICGRGTLETLLGGTLAAVPEHWAQGSPAALLPLGVPQTLIVGTRDRVIPSRIVEAYERAALAAGDRVKLVEVTGADHMQLVEPGSQAWPAVLENVLALVGASH